MHKSMIQLTDMELVKFEISQFGFLGVVIGACVCLLYCSIEQPFQIIGQEKNNKWGVCGRAPNGDGLG